MPGRLAIDFGTSNSVVALWDEPAQVGRAQVLSPFSTAYDQNGESVPLIPSLIHYTDDNRRWMGDQVLQQNLRSHPSTFRWMKRYITNRSPARKMAGGQMRSNFDAGGDFLAALLAVAVEQFGIADEEIALTIPVESFEHYDNWMTDVVEAAGIARYRLIDEPSAAALGYGVNIQSGDVYLVFDFGGGTLDVSVVLIEESGPDRANRHCRVLGKAGASVGGATIDQWLFMDLLRRHGKSDADDDVRRMSTALLQECQAAKERLSHETQAEIMAVDPDTGGVLQAGITRDDFEELLDEHEMFATVDRTIRRALAASAERGYQDEHIKQALVVGGSSLIPCVHKLVRRIFGRERVTLGRPMDAVARGAAAFVAGVDFFDHIQHDYAIRHIDPDGNGYQYTTVVEGGTAYPTAQPVFRKLVKAAYDGQVSLGIAIYEAGAELRRDAQHPAVELVFDPTGAARIVQVDAQEEEDRARFWMNEQNPTFLTAEPPANRGEARFEVEFTIDANKRLRVTARDLHSDQLTLREFPVVKLT